MNKIIAFLFAVILSSCSNISKLKPSNDGPRTPSKALISKNKSQKSLDKLKKNGILQEENGLSVDCKSTKCADINTIEVIKSTPAPVEQEKPIASVFSVNQTENPNIVKSHEDFVKHMDNRHSKMAYRKNGKAK